MLNEKKLLKKTLILVDLQNDFCHGGSLAVPGGEEIVSIANQLQPFFDLIIATQDWHPADHASFASNHPGKRQGEVIEVNGFSQILWPDHCVQGTHGAKFHSNLNTNNIHKIFHKGIDKNIDSYSAFFDNAHERATGLGDYLQKQYVTDIYIMGLATDYCVKYSALDAVHLGFHVTVIADACRGVELQAGDTAKAMEEMQAAGVKMIEIKYLIRDPVFSSCS